MPDQLKPFYQVVAYTCIRAYFQPGIITTISKYKKTISFSYSSAKEPGY